MPSAISGPIGPRGVPCGIGLGRRCARALGRVGRLATRVAMILRGKHRPTFTPHNDTGEYVIVINADKVKLTGRKMQQKIYYRHTGYVGNLKAESLEQLLKRAPERVLMQAVKGMLPKNPLGRKMLGKLRVVSGSEHPHEAQQPLTLEI